MSKFPCWILQPIVFLNNANGDGLCCILQEMVKRLRTAWINRLEKEDTQTQIFNFRALSASPCRLCDLSQTMADYLLLEAAYHSRGPRGVVGISLGDIRYVPTRSKFAIFQGFLMFWSNAPKLRSVGGGGYVYAFCNL